MPWDLIISRWLHLGSIIVLVGGTVFLRFLLIPASTVLGDTDESQLRDKLTGRWKTYVHVLITLILITGLYTVARVAGDRPPLWHMLFGIKFILALVLFFFASALVGRAKPFERFRQARRFWLGVNISIAVVIVMISGVLRFIPPKSQSAETDPPAVVTTAMVTGLVGLVLPARQ